MNSLNGSTEPDRVKGMNGTIAPKHEGAVMSLEWEDPIFVKKIFSSYATSWVENPGARVLQGAAVPVPALGGRSCSS